MPDWLIEFEFLWSKQPCVSHATYSSKINGAHCPAAGEVLALGSSASLSSTSPPPAVSKDRVGAKKFFDSVLDGVVRVAGAINGRWFSFSGFRCGGYKSTTTEEATQAAFEQLIGTTWEAGSSSEEHSIFDYFDTKLRRKTAVKYKFRSLITSFWNNAYRRMLEWFWAGTIYFNSTIWFL